MDWENYCKLLSWEGAPISVDRGENSGITYIVDPLCPNTGFALFYMSCEIDGVG
jgi:hypothetical protein